MKIPFFYQMEDYTCAAAVLRMAFGLYGIYVPEELLIKKLETNRETGTSRQNMYKVVSEFGLQHSHKLNATIGDLIVAHEESNVAIVLYKIPEFEELHYGVIKGFSEHRIYLFDPWFGPDHSYPLELFEKIWVDADNRKWYMTIDGVVNIPFFYQHESYSSAAAVLRMALGLYGIYVSERLLTKKLKTSKETGTPRRNLYKVASEFGLQHSHKLNATIDDLMDAHEKSDVLIVHYTIPTLKEVHYSIVKGFSEDNIYLLDPLSGPNQTYQLKLFEDMWADSKKKKWYMTINGVVV